MFLSSVDWALKLQSTLSRSFRLKQLIANIDHLHAIKAERQQKGSPCIPKYPRESQRKFTQKLVDIIVDNINWRIAATSRTAQAV